MAPGAELRAGAVRRFRIEVGACRRCGREWPGHVTTCRECAAMVGEPRQFACARVVPPVSSRLHGPAFAVTMAVELSRRVPAPDDDWASELWAALGPRLSEAIRVRPGQTGSICVVWPLEHPDAMAMVAERALELRLRVAHRAGATEFRGGIALGVVGASGGTDAAERSAERLALAAAPGQWLVSDEVARRLDDRFQFRPVGLCPRWPMAVDAGGRALTAPLVPPALPSAVSGEVPRLVLGRARERRQLLAEIAGGRSGQRRVVLVSAPAGGGKSYLLRRVVADAGINLAGGVAFPPLGSHAMDPLRALLAMLEETGGEHSDQRLGAALGEAATRRGRIEASAIVVDDVHWARPEAIAELRDAIRETADDSSVAWILSTRSAATARLESLVELADLRVELPPLEPPDRAVLLAARLGDLPDSIRAHVACRAERGNPLYLDHLAAGIAEGSVKDVLPGSLHEAVLARLDGLVKRAQELARWPRSTGDPRRALEALERELADWLDRLETSDVADLATIGRYLAHLRRADFELVIARSLLGMPVQANRRVAWAVERLGAASTDALVDYLEALAAEGRGMQAVHEATSAAERAERSLRLGDAARLLEFAARHDPQAEVVRKRGDLALALGRPRDAIVAYDGALRSDDRNGDLERRIARAEALIGETERADTRLRKLVGRPGLEPTIAYAAQLDLARLGALAPPAERGATSASLRRRIARTRAWTSAAQPEAAREAIVTLTLVGQPAACAAELVESAALSRLAGLTVPGLTAAATDAARRLGNPFAVMLLEADDAVSARGRFLHWEV